MKHKIVGICVSLMMIVTALSAAETMNGKKNDVADNSGGYVPAATPTQITASITQGIAWLAGMQNGDGSWGTTADNYLSASTAFALIKLQDYAYETAYPQNPWYGPFDTKYIYYNKVHDGWAYLFTKATIPNTGVYVRKQTLWPQEHPTGSGYWDNPDTNGNHYGIYLGNLAHNDWYHVYRTGIFLMALVASGDPTHENEGNIDFDLDGSPDTFWEIANDTVDWLAFAQGDTYIPVGQPYVGSCARGGYAYGAINNSYRDNITVLHFPDNSVSGYAYVGLIGAAAVLSPHPGTIAKAFACNVPAWVKYECRLWVQYIQYTGSDPVYHGGSFYRYLTSVGSLNEINLLKTGNLLAEMTFCGLQSDPRFNWALEYIERTWHEKLVTVDPEYVTGWGYQTDHTNHPCTDPAEYQTMFCLMKGFGYSGITTINLGPSNPNQDWYNVETPHSPQYDDFASVLVVQQNTDGSWPVSPYSFSDPGRILSTIWALLALEKIPNYPKPDAWKYDDLEGEKQCVKQCDYINYTICVHNPSLTNDLHNVVITDPLPDEESFVDASPGYSISSRTITWNIGTLPIYQQVCVWLLVLVRPETVNGTIIHNKALITNNDTASVYAEEDSPVCGCCFKVKITGTRLEMLKFGVNVTITNICDHNETNIPWKINITGGILNLLKKTTSGTITNLPPSGTTTIQSPIFGLGKITITVIVDDCPPFIATAFLLGPFVLNVHQIPHSSYEYSGCGC